MLETGFLSRVAATVSLFLACYFCTVRPSPSSLIIASSYVKGWVAQGVNKGYLFLILATSCFFLSRRTVKCESVQTCVQIKEEGRGRGRGDCVKGVPGVIFGPFVFKSGHFG